MADGAVLGWLVPRARLFGGGGGVGLIVGIVLTGLVVLLLGDLEAASANAFSVGTIVLAIGVLGWSASVFVGGGNEVTREVLGFGPDWTERGSRRAMTVVIGLGLGMMTGVILATMALDYLG